jgi:ribonuclease VapC
LTLDSSALIAILFAEPDYMEIVDRILEADDVRVAAPTLVETSLVLAGRRRASPSSTVDEVESLVKELGVTIVSFGEREWRTAVAAFLRFGRGRHKASLNFGDCLAYAAAMSAGDSLLFVGRDLRETDVRPA